MNRLRENYAYVGRMAVAIGLVAGLCLWASAPVAQGCNNNWDNCSTLGDITVWQAGVGNWLSASNWSLGLPSTYKSARIDNGGTANIGDGCASAKYLQVGFGSAGQGVVIMGTDATLQVHCGTHVGVAGSGFFMQTGGKHSISDGDLCLGYDYMGNGTYFLSGGTLSADEGVMVGRSGLGSIIQNAGMLQTAHGSVILGRFADSYGAYSLNDGRLIASCGEVVGWDGDADLTQNGGSNLVRGTLYMARGTNSFASYYLYGGLLDASKEVIGQLGSASIRQYGGINSMCGDLDLTASASLNSSSYSLNGGLLQVGGSETIGAAANGVFLQGGGVHQVGCTLAVGEKEDSSGLLILFGGNLEARKLRVGALLGTGLLEIDDPSPLISARDEVMLGELSTLVAVPGAAIHMIGAVSSFLNESVDETALAGLANLEVIFEGGIQYSSSGGGYGGGCGGGGGYGGGYGCNPQPRCGQQQPRCQQVQWSVYEVAGTDSGLVPQGFVDNFALAKLTVGGAKAAAVKLVDRHDNGNRVNRNGEALYVHNVTVAAGSTLDLGGLNVYADGTVDIQGTVTGGVVHQ